MNKQLQNRLGRLLKKIGLILFLSIVIQFNLRAEASLQSEVHAYLQNLPFEMPEIQVPEFADRTFNILEYGAIGNGQVLNTEAFKKTIDACAQSGGGKVLVPPGIWLTGPIQLASNINLHLEQGALILFTPDHTQYPIIKAPERGLGPASPIYGFNLKNVAITGAGILDGSGDAWRPVKKFKTTESQWEELVKSGGVVDPAGKIWWPSQESLDGEAYLKKLKSRKKKNDIIAEDYLPARHYLRPYMVLLIKCKNVLIDGVTIRNSPKFALVPNWCEQVVIRNVKVQNEWWAQNGDGIDINSCQNVLVYQCIVTAGDDAICMKSKKNKNSDEPSLKNVVISDCIVYHGHGGFVIGSNTDGGMQNISVKNCNFIGTDTGLRFKSVRVPGGWVEQIFIQNIFMKDIVEEAIIFNSDYEGDGKTEMSANPITEMTPRFQNIKFTDIYCVGARQAVLVNGLPEMPVQDLQMTNVVISADKGFETKYAADFNLKNVKIIPKSGNVYTLNQTKDFIIDTGFVPDNTKIFLKVMGQATENIRLVNTDLSKVTVPFDFGSDTNQKAIKVGAEAKGKEMN